MAIARQIEVAQYYNKKVKIRQFTEEDLVLHNGQANKPPTG